MKRRMREFRLEEESECSNTGEEAGAGCFGGSTVAVEPLRVEIMLYYTWDCYRSHGSICLQTL